MRCIKVYSVPKLSYALKKIFIFNNSMIDGFNKFNFNY